MEYDWSQGLVHNGGYGHLGGGQPAEFLEFEMNPFFSEWIGFTTQISW